MLTDIICFVTNTVPIRLRIGPTEEASIDVYGRLAAALGNPLIKEDGNRYKCNFRFTKTKESINRLQEVCAEYNTKELWRFYNTIREVKDNSHFIMVLCDSDMVFNRQEQLATFFYLMSANTGKDPGILRSSFEQYEKDITKYYEIITCIGTNKRGCEYIGHKEKADYRCRICGKNVTSGALFTKKAHAISQVIGNKSIVLLDECDNCNEKIVGKLENSLATYFYAPRLFFGLRGQHSKVAHQESGLEIFNSTGNNIEIKASDTDKCRIISDGNKPKFELIINCGKYNRQDIYRILSKFAISVMPEEYFDYDRFLKLREWIQNKKSCKKLPLIAVCIEADKDPRYPHITVYKRKTGAPESIPLYICDFFAVAHRFLFELPFMECECKMTSEEKWQRLLKDVPALGLDKDWTFESFDHDEMVDYKTKIIGTTKNDSLGRSV